MRDYINFLKSYFKDKSLVGVEIGVNNCENALELLEELNIERFYLIDPFLNYQGFGGDGWDNISQSVYDKNFLKAQEILKKYPNTTLIREKSSEAVTKIPEIDFVYIDGNHTFNYVLNDVQSYYLKLKQGGVLSGDNLEYKDVSNVVSQFFLLTGLNLYGAKRRVSFEWWGIKNGV